MGATIAYIAKEDGKPGRKAWVLKRIMIIHCSRAWQSYTTAALSLAYRTFDFQVVHSNFTCG